MDTSFARTWLRLEGLAAFGVAATVYAHLGLGWWWFVALFLAPDLSMLGYLGGTRAGALAYNLAHTYVGALLLVALAAATWPHRALAAAGLIWCAHIGLDRALGYGLKSRDDFGLTHLGRVGRKR